MIDLVKWLEGNEKQAADLYAHAREKWADDKTLSTFLEKLHQDELSHAEMMQQIAQMISNDPNPPQCDITFTPETKAEVLAPLREVEALLSSGSITRQQLWNGIARIEFGEWNDIFLYVVALFKERSPELERMVASVQAHQARIAHFLHDLPPEERPSLDVATLQKVWEEKYLVVEDNAIVREFIVNILMRKGTAYAAKNGEDALELTRRHFFNVIITDIEMPVMNGIQFYKTAVAEDPRWKGHFLFISFALAPDREQFLKKEGIPCLQKPFDPRALLSAVDRIARVTNIAM